ncbi:hypothetical protein SACS_0091 [Parasaccharibacter apium]|uniref:Uncharacterized protein n=1 Tax=Parasaccharibacter apium TaxID=1510841 RepID=A0A7U7G472_9PROT|nr:hypothetical protein SACS_0091 [Parasaccharibacter apium]
MLKALVTRADLRSFLSDIVQKNPAGKAPAGFFLFGGGKKVTPFS